MGKAGSGHGRKGLSRRGKSWGTGERGNNRGCRDGCPASAAGLSLPCGAVGPAVEQLERARGRLGCS